MTRARIGRGSRRLTASGCLKTQDFMSIALQDCSSKRKACRAASGMADVLKNALVPETSALEFVLRPAVEEQEILAAPFVIGDK